VLPLAELYPPPLRHGSVADAPAEMGGPWPGAADADAHVSVLAGLAASLPGVEVLHARGVAHRWESMADVGAAVELCATPTRSSSAWARQPP